MEMSYASVPNKKGNPIAAKWLGSTLLFLHPYTGQEMAKKDIGDVENFTPIGESEYADLLEKNKAFLNAPLFFVGESIPGLGKVSKVHDTALGAYQYIVDGGWYAENCLRDSYFAAKAKTIGFSALADLAAWVYCGEKTNIEFLKWFYLDFIQNKAQYEAKWASKNTRACGMSNPFVNLEHKLSQIYNGEALPKDGKVLDIHKFKLKEKLELKLDKLKEQRSKESARISGAIDKMGWGHGTRHAKVMPFSFSKQNALDEKIKAVLREIENI